MQEHEFYADPTVFDLWLARAGDWLEQRLHGLRPWGWTLAFSAMAALFAATAVGVFVAALIDGAQHAVAWNRNLAQVITIMMALLASQALLQQALKCWPEERAMPRRWRHLVRLCGWPVPGAGPRRAARKPVAVRRPQKTAPEAASRADIQAFFSGVRAAGVNVTIARALFAAGVRTPAQLCRASDERLLAIRGVGPATVCKLRAYFRAG